MLCVFLPTAVFALQDESREIFSTPQNKFNNRTTTINRYTDVASADNGLPTTDGVVEILGGLAANTRIFRVESKTLVLPTGRYTEVPVTSNRMISIGIEEQIGTEMGSCGHGGKQYSDLSQGMACAPASRVNLTVEMLADVFDRAINQNGVTEAAGIEMKDGVIELVAEKKHSPSERASALAPHSAAASKRGSNGQ